MSIREGRETILDENGMVRKGIMDARERGVLFDASNGCNNYDLEISRKAMKQGFIPDIISSDINTAGFYLQPLHSLPRIMSKYLDMGMCLERVLDAVTVCPARLIGREELASLDMAAPRMWPFLSWWKGGMLQGPEWTYIYRASGYCTPDDYKGR